MKGAPLRTSSRMFRLFLFSALVYATIHAATSQECSASDAAATATCTRKPALTLGSLSKFVIDSQYAVRGEVLLRATALEKQGRKIVYCNIGNPQALGQKPLTFPRRVMSLVLNPELIDQVQYPADVVARAKEYLAFVKQAPGAYSDSQGVSGVREQVAEFISQRDGAQLPRANASDVYLTSGASQGVEFIMRLFNQDDAVLVPIPQYPLYSALASLLGEYFQGYELGEDGGWSLQAEAIEKAIAQAEAKGKHVRAIVVINPGNPTGNTLPRRTIEEIVRVAADRNLVVMADEVYQANVYTDVPFVSMRKVLLELKAKEPQRFALAQMVSFHSISKGVSGECGLRGGYMEVLGFDDEVRAQLYKLASIGLCPNVPGQIAVGLMVKPPAQGEPSYDVDHAERTAVFESLHRRAVKLVEGLNRLPGVKCNPAQGAMYAFPSITLPPRFVKEAESKGKHPDTLYSLELLEATGVVVVPGNGFGQRDGTYHFRTTILPPEDVLDSVVQSIGEFHRGFVERWR